MRTSTICRLSVGVVVAFLSGTVSLYAQVSNVFFSSTSNCLGGSSATFVPGGAPVSVSLCMNTSTATCGHTVILQSAAMQNDQFVVTGYTPGPNFPEKNTDIELVPVPLQNPGLIRDLGSTPTSGSSPAGTNQLLATFTLAPQATATGNSYVISVSNSSIIAVVKNNDTTCGLTDIPDEVLMNSVPAATPVPPIFTLNKNPAPAITSANTVTFSTVATPANTFTVTASGNPAPTLSVTGTLPGGVTFVPATGVLSGTPSGGNQTYPLTFTATNGAGPAATQSFTLVVSGLASQSITFNDPGPQTFSSTPLALNASSTSGLAVVFTSNTPSICTVSGTNLTMVSAGQCTVNADQPGNGTSVAAAARVSQTFDIVATAPGAPTIGTATAGDGQISVAFTAPTSNGGLGIASFGATCTSSNGGVTKSGSGTGSPIIVTGLTNGATYTCTVSATNTANITGLSSAASNAVSPAAGMLTLLKVVSRKTHGASGEFNLDLDTTQLINQNVTVESRAQLSGGVASHTIVFQFSGPVSVAGTATTTAGTAAVPTINNGNEVVVVLSGIADRQRVTVSLMGVNGSVNATVSVGFLVGDVNNTRSVDTLDLSPIRARAGATSVNINTYKLDLNHSGTIDTLDISAVRARAGVSI